MKTVVQAEKGQILDSLLEGMTLTPVIHLLCRSG
jgi:hypothetical protein